MDPAEFYAERRVIAERGRRAISISVPERSHLRRMAEDFLLMIDAYLSDAENLAGKGDPLRALEAISYAYGWMDAGVRIGIFKAEDEDLHTFG